MKIVKYKWYTPPNPYNFCIGIVTIDDGFQVKSYIGIAQGIDEEEDLKYIVEHGTPFSYWLCRVLT